MKCRTFLIIGGVVVAGIVVYEVYKHLCNRKDECVDTKTESEDSTPSVQEEFLSAEALKGSTTDIYETREAVVSTVKERHCEAAEVLQESLNTIFNESEIENIVTKNSDALEKTGSELDDLLK